MTDISCKVVSEVKKDDVQHIVKLSVFGAEAEPGIKIGRLHDKKRKSQNNLELPTPSYGQVHLSKFL